MKKWVCPVCGYVHEGDTPPEFCPQCKVPGSKFIELKESEKLVFADEHKVGIAKAVEDEEILAGLKANFEGECTEVGMYLAMARAAHREGYPEVGLYYEKAAWEEAEHAANVTGNRGYLMLAPIVFVSFLVLIEHHSLFINRDALHWHG